jgi:hypothetical protein
MPLNPFGVAFQEASFVWTKFLCHADSDGDGLTNGQELGDPCCLWEADDTPSEYTTSFTPLHPGFANNASEVSMYVEPDCFSTTPLSKATKLGQFNEGEVQKVVDLFIDNFTIPMPGSLSDRTDYTDFALNFPDDSAEIFHVVRMEALVMLATSVEGDPLPRVKGGGNGFLHHFVVRGCNQKFPAELHGKAITRDLRQLYGCTENVGGWAPGKNIIDMPPWAGEPIGRGAGIVAFSVNVHYDNPTLAKGVVSNDGIRILYTPNLRSKELVDFTSTQISYNPMMRIPPTKSRFFVTRSCEVIAQEPFHLVLSSFHAHLLGREMYSELTPANEASADLASAPIWHFDDQVARNILDQNITLKSGDHVQTTCIFDSTARSETTVMGQETIDEMCWAAFKGWPRSADPKCNGSIWTGELSEDEQGFGLGSRHPVQEATSIWDGMELTTGGKFIGPVSGPSCGNAARLTATQCNNLVNFVAGSTELEHKCDGDLSKMVPPRFIALLTGRTILEICCAEACREMCSTHILCLSETTTTPNASSFNRTQSTFNNTQSTTSASFSASCMLCTSMFIMLLFLMS